MICTEKSGSSCARALTRSDFRALIRVGVSLAQSDRDRLATRGKSGRFVSKPMHERCYCVERSRLLTVEHHSSPSSAILEHVSPDVGRRQTWQQKAAILRARSHRLGRCSQSHCPNLCCGSNARGSVVGDPRTVGHARRFGACWFKAASCEPSRFREIAQKLSRKRKGLFFSWNSSLWDCSKKRLMNSLTPLLDFRKNK